MKHTIEGFSQKKMVELGLNVKDAFILRWFIDCRNRMRQRHFDVLGRCLYQVNYQAVLDDLPALGIKTTDRVQRLFKKYVDLGLLEHETLRVGGTFAYYGVKQTLLDMMEA